MRLIRILTVCFVAATCFSASSATIAATTWGTPTTISGDTDVVTTGSLVFAYSFGASGVPATTINGVTFSPFVVTGSPSSVTVGQLTLSTFNPQFPSPIPMGSTNSNSNSSASAPFAGLSGNYKLMLQSEVTECCIASLNGTINGLTPGQSYTIQLWANSSSADASSFSLDFPAATLDPNTTNAAGGVGQFVVGTFVATGSTQGFSLSSGDSRRLSGIQLRAALVPEPATIALLTSALVPLGVRRKRQ